MGTGPLDMDAMNVVFDGSGSGLTDEVLATMQAIKNPAWWQNMMMPGFTWPEMSMAGNVNASVGHGHSPYQGDVNGDAGLGGGHYYAASSSSTSLGMGMPMGYSNFQTAQTAPVHLG